MSVIYQFQFWFLFNSATIFTLKIDFTFSSICFFFGLIIDIGFYQYLPIFKTSIEISFKFRFILPTAIEKYYLKLF